jgi:hypothetical protein
MADTKKTKKVNQLKVKDCESIVSRLYNQNENKYYQEVLSQYKRLVSDKEYKDKLNQLQVTFDNNKLKIQKTS